MTASKNVVPDWKWWRDEYIIARDEIERLAWRVRELEEIEAKHKTLNGELREKIEDLQYELMEEYD